MAVPVAHAGPDPTVAQARRQQREEELCVAAIRALAGDAGLHFRGGRLHRGSRRLPPFAAHLHPSLAHDPFASFRGAADGLALRLLHSDEAVHAARAPVGDGARVERLIFDLLEQLRCESLADPAHAGVQRNLRRRFEDWSLHVHHAGLTDTASGLLLYTLAQVVRARVCAEPVVEATEDHIEATRCALAPRIGHALAALRLTRHDQAAYATPALAIAQEVAAMLSEAEADAAGGARPRQPRPTAPMFSLLVDPDNDPDAAAGALAPGDSRVLSEATDGYRVYTRAWDSERHAGTLVRPALLAAHREQLDRRVAAQGANVPRLARALQALLAAPAPDGWDGAQEHGRIDGRRLAQLVAAPTERRLFRIEREVPQADAAITLLVDCSGSMKTHAESVAMLADIVLRAAELAGAQTELLGFTTGAWHGGRAARAWQRAGRPPHPGRLNELLHLVFKDAATPWRRARRDIAAMLEPHLYREGVDGEAVAWACARLRALDVRRRLLLVVSDGCPMDSATQQANDEHYLDQHLRETVAREEARGDIAVHGIGVGLDLSPYYGRCQAIDVQAPPGNGVFTELLQLIGGHRRR